MRHVLLLSALACKGSATIATIVDVDGDGFNTEVDCDDNNASVHPGSIDLAHDDVDANCDGTDGGESFLRDLPFTLVGSSVGEDFGAVFTICDVTDDGQDDLIAARPSRGGAARIQVYSGPLQEGSFTSIDAELDIDLDGELLWSLHCEDIDGDGRSDLIAQRQGRGGGPGGPAIFYQPPGGFIDDLTAADAVYIQVPAASDEFPTAMQVGDFDGDGRADIVFARQYENIDDDLYLVPGGLYVGDNDVLDVGIVVDTAWDFTTVLSKLGDINGDGDIDLAVCGNEEPFCRLVDDLSGGDFDAAVLHELEPPFSGTFTSGDFDGDGSADDLAMKPSRSELFNLQLDAFEQRSISMVTPDANQMRFPGSAVAMLLNTGDIDGDMIEDIAMIASSGADRGTQVRVVSGALASDPPGQINAVSVLSAQESAGIFVGAASGDLDGDGRPDVLFGAGSPEAEGLIGGWLSSSIAMP